MADKRSTLSRRLFLQETAAGMAGFALAPYFNFGAIAVDEPMTRLFGRIGFEVTTLGLGGQASLQWTPDDVDPVAIILKAHKLGVNYFDTSNVYGPSQLNFGKAFKALDLIPGSPGYNERSRRELFLTTKTHLRHAKGGDDFRRNRSNGGPGLKTLDDVKRSLSQMFGDGSGAYPEGAYLDMVLIHNLSRREEMDAAYLGYDSPDPDAEEIGALAALRDVRDGTNLTGLNPREERLIRHIGFSGHYDTGLMMEMIRRDHQNLLEGMLVAINANDRLNHNMQYNVIPVAAAKNMGVIAMKVFADGAMYTKPAHWTQGPHEVVKSVGSPTLPSRPLIEYALSTPGVHTAIIGIGKISPHAELCQATQNLSAAQIALEELAESDREAVEQMTAPVKDGMTNYFQMDARPLTAPSLIHACRVVTTEGAGVKVSWDTALAGDAPLSRYDILHKGLKVLEYPYEPQTSLDPFSVTVPYARGEYSVRVVDAEKRVAVTEVVEVA